MSGDFLAGTLLLVVVPVEELELFLGILGAIVNLVWYFVAG